MERNGRLCKKISMNMSGRTVRVEMCKVFGSPWERSPATFSPFLSFTNFGRPPGVDVDDDDDDDGGGDACVNLYWDASCLSPATFRSAITLDDDDKNYLINRSVGSGTHWALTSS